MEKNNVFLLGLLLLAGVVLVGCVQSPPPYGTPTPTASPTGVPPVSPSPTATIGSGFPEKIRNPLDLTEMNATGENERFYIRMISPTKFELVATVYTSTPCSETTAYWNSGYDSIRIYFEHSQPEGVYCPQVLKLRTFKTVVDYSSVVALRPFKKVQVYNLNELVDEQKFDGMFCGGIAAFPCPYAYYCNREGSRVDALVNCVFNASVYDGPMPA